MNDLVRIAQAGEAGPGQARLRLTKPADGVAQVVQVTPGLVLDLQDIAAQDVVMVRAGDRLIILFSDQSAIVLAGFYGGDGRPLAGLDVDVGQGGLPAAQLAAILPISADTSILPASGPASAGGGPPSSSFQAATVSPEALAGGVQALDLLTDDGVGPVTELSDEPPPQVNNVAAFGGEGAGVVVEDAATAASGVLTVSDADGGEAMVVAQSGIAGAYGTFSVDASGAWRYLLDNGHAEVQALGAGDTLTERFDVVSVDNSATTTVVVTIIGANDLPLLGGVAEGAVTEDRALDTSGALTIVDVDTDESRFVAQSDVAGRYGTFSVDAAGAWSYLLDNGNSAVQALGIGRSLTETFTVQSVDGSASKTVTVVINGTNDAPGAADGADTVSEDGTLAGVATGTDIDGDPLTFAVVGDPPAGLTFNSDGTWSYLPPESHQGLDDGETAAVTFQYRAHDGTAESNVATVTITVTGANDAPVAQDDTATVSEDGTLVGQAVTATDVDAEDLAYTIVGDRPEGLTFNADGSWSFAPPAAHQGLDDGETATVTFQYKASDGTADSNVATVTITVTGANDAPVARDGAATVSEDGTLTGQAATATDVDVEDLTYAVAGDPPAGLTFNSDGTWSYLPPESHQGLDDGESATVTFQYQANDGTAESNVATVTITVTGTNDAPVAQNGTAFVSEDEMLTGQAVIATDRDGEPLTYSIVGTMPEGLTFNEDGTWSYAPPSSYQDLDTNEYRTATFRYRANDGTAESHVATVTITVGGRNDAPVAQDAAATVSEDSTLAGQAVTATDVDVETLTYSVVGGTPAGLTFNADGTWSFAPTAHQGLDDGETATVTFQYRANDGTASSNTATVTITVTGANDAPVAQNGTATVAEGGTLSGRTVTATDVDGESLTYAIVGDAPAGLTFNANGTWSYTVPASYETLPFGQSATVAFQYTANDGTADSNVATQTITITGADDAPVARSDSGSMTEDQGSKVFDVLANDTMDPDAGAVTTVSVGTISIPGGAGYGLDANDISVLATSSGLEVTLLGTDWNKLSFGASLGVTIRYTLTGDQPGSTSTNQLVLTVTGVNDAPVLDAGKTPTITAVEDAPAPSGTVGTLISALLDPAGGGGNDNFADVDGFGSYGIAITGVNAGQGAWYWSSGGGGWTAINPAVLSSSNALLLPSTYRLYFKPNANFSGTIDDAITFRAWDRSSGTPTTFVNTTINGGSTPYSVETDTISLTVTNVNDAPTITGLTHATIAENALGALIETFTVADIDSPDGLTFRVLDGAGTLDPRFVVVAAAGTTFGQPGTYELRLAAGASLDYEAEIADGSAAIALKVEVDDHGAANNLLTVQVTVTVTDVQENRPPVAQDGTPTVAEDGVLNGQTVAATDPDGNPLTYAIVGTPPEGLIFNADGTWSYAPPASAQDLDLDETRQVTFQYKANDGLVDSNTATVTITIAGANDAPVAQVASASVSEDGMLTGQAVVASDIDDEPVTYALFGSGPEGLIFNADGTWSYAPPAALQGLAANQSQQVTFEYRAYDGTAYSEPATVTITVTGENDLPVVEDVTASVSEDGVASGLLSASDVDGDMLTYELVGPSFGVALDADGSWSWDPPSQFQSLDDGETRELTVRYRASDGTGESNIGTMTITVVGANDAPVAADASASVFQGGGISSTVSRASDVDGDALSHTLVGDEVEGLTFNADGTWVYIAPAATKALDDGETQVVTFQYKANDGTVDSNVATVTITVRGSNDWPRAEDAAATVSEDGTLTGQAAATDVDGEDLTYVLFGAAPAGLIFNPDGSWFYSPAAHQGLDDGETATVMFRYRAYDGTEEGNVATVTITVTGANDAPVAQDVTATVSEDGTLTGRSVTATDADGETLAYAVAGTAPEGLSFNSDGTWSFAVPATYQTLAAGQSATVTFQYTANDGTAESNVATETITITGANDLPVARPDSGTMTEGQGPAVFNVVGNDTLDIDNGAANTIAPGFINVYFGEAYGITRDDIAVTVTSSGLEVTLLGSDWDKIARFSSVIFTVNYTLNGNPGDFATNQLTVTVNGVNDAPVLDASKSPAIIVSEDAPAPAGPGGTLISTLIDPAGGGGLDNVSDADSAFTGIAITAIDASRGTWYYSSGSGGWSVINPAVLSASNALLLPASYSLAFKPNADFSGTIEDAITFRAWDFTSGTPAGYGNTTVNGGTTPYSTATGTISLTVDPVNDAPGFAGLSDASIAEHETGALLRTFTVSDIDTAGGLTFRVLDGSGVVDPRFVVVPASGTGAGQPGTYELRLAEGVSLDFAAENADGSPTIALTVEVDDHGTANAIATASMVLTVTDVIENHAPTLPSLQQYAFHEDATSIHFVVPQGADEDGDTLTYTLVGDGPEGVTFDSDGTWSFQTPNLQHLGAGDSEVFTFQYKASDGKDDSNIATVHITINGRNDAPVLGGIDAATFLESSVGAAAQVVDADVSLSDVDTPVLAGGSVTVRYTSGGGIENHLSIRDLGTGAGQIGLNGRDVTFGGITIGTINAAAQGADGEDLVVDLNGNATLAAVEAMIESLTYRNTSDTPAASRTLGVTVNDGAGASTTATVVVNVTAENDAPVLSGFGDVTFLENTVNAALQGIAPSVSLTDVDSANFLGGTLTLRTVDDASSQDVLGFIHQGFAARQIGISGSDVFYGASTIGKLSVGGDGSQTVALNGNATAAAVQALIGRAAYRNTSNTPEATRTVEITLDHGGTSVSAQSVITVTPEVDAPILAGVTNKSFLESAVNAAPQIIHADVTLIDLDSSTLGGGRVTVGYSAGGGVQNQLSVRNVGTGADEIGLNGLDVTFGGVTIGTISTTAQGVDGGQLIVDLNGFATPAAVETLIENLTYRNTSDAPLTSRTLGITVEDGTGGTVTRTFILNITPENDVAVLSGLDDVTFLENAVNAAPQLIDGSVTVTDPDTANYAGGVLTIGYADGGSAQDNLGIRHQGFSVGQIGVSGTAVYYGTTGGVVPVGTITANGAAGAALAISLSFGASPVAVEALIESLTYQNGSDTPNPTRTISITLNDGAGGVTTAQAQITVTPESDLPAEDLAPVAQNGAATVSEDGTLTGQQVVATDPENGTLTFAVIGAAPAGLTFNPNGSWSYAPPASHQGLDDGEQATVTFQYKANDGTADSNAATVAVTVTGANDAPVAQGGSASVSEDGTLTGRSVTATDVDGEALTYSLVGPGLSGLTFNADGIWSYTPPSGYQSLRLGESELLQFQFKANDGSVDSNTQSVTITVTGADDSPIARSDTGAMIENQGTTTFNVLANDTLDPDAGVTTTLNLGFINVYGGSGYGLDDSDLSVAATSSGLQVTMVGTDWDRLAAFASVTVTVSYTLVGDQPSSFSGNGLTLTITGVNDAPVLDASKSPGITVEENAPFPSGAVGTVISTLVDPPGGGGFDNVSDPDATAFGIAIMGVDASQGTWYWSPGDGGWSAINPAVLSESNALLLPSTSALYFQPAAGYDGTIAEAITFRAWDRTGGTPGSYGNTTVSGGTTGFSTAIDTISLTVEPTGEAMMMSAMVDEGEPTLVSGASGSDILVGTDGNDILLGGLGADILVGELGADVFAYTDTAQGGDTIRDFTSGDDAIGILNSILGTTDTGFLDFDGSSAGGSAILFEGIAGATAAAQNNSAKLLYDTTGHDLYYDSDGGASASGRILLAHLENGSVLEAGDIRLMSA